MDDDAARRRLARAAWPVHRRALGDEAEAVVTAGTPGDRVAMAHALSLEAWAMSGRPMPDYARGDLPGALVRGSR